VGRLAAAAAAGRLGVSHSICGRLRDLGGSAEVSSVRGEGTEVTLRIPRAPASVAPMAGGRPEATGRPEASARLAI
jgi:hypothetical protein